MRIRAAVSSDAMSMSVMLKHLVTAGNRKSPADEAFVLSNYIEDPERVVCFVVFDGTENLLGFQSLKWAIQGNTYDTPVGWGIIGTHVALKAGRQGVGTNLFEVTKAAARDAGLESIEAYIGSANHEDQAYYEKIGFRTYRNADDGICKCYDLTKL